MRTPVLLAAPPVLDASQRAVVEHPWGPLLVLGGPGTGKTATLVEAVAARVRAGTPPERILVLTFDHRAALALRERMAARLGTQGPQATTFPAFSYGLLRAHQPADRYAEPLRLLSGPEQDLLVRELLAGQAGQARDGRAHVRWPDDLRAALTTRGFADEVRAVLARSRELGLAPDALRAFADRAGRPDWRAAADFLAEYLDVTDLQGVLDYTELAHRAVRLLRRPEVHAEQAARYDAVYVDEYQDTDPAQVRLLLALAGGGRTLVAFGDPDQSVYAFRGADVNGILDFPGRFPQAGGRPAPVRVLTAARRAAPLLAAARHLTDRMPPPRLPAAAARPHRAPRARLDAPGAVAVRTYPTPGAEIDSIADILRRAHLEDGFAWRDMAVLVRSGTPLPALRRALAAAGVPVDLQATDAPLHAEPAVAPVLLALRVAAQSALAEPPGPARAAAADPAPDGTPTTADGPGKAAGGGARSADPAPPQGPGNGREEEPPALKLTVEDALTLLASPLGGMDAADLRRLGRALREEERTAGRAVPRPSDVLIAEAVARPELLTAHDPAYARGAQRLGRLLKEAHRTLAAGGTAEEALWGLWTGSPWSARLERSAVRGGPAGRNADRDLDAVVALFETAARAEERTGGRGALNLIEELSAFDIAADTRTGAVVRPGAVRLTTAHRAKGQEWRLVVVAGVQEGVWPDLRRRGSLLEADRIGTDGLAPPLTQGALLAEERRLFYVAATRARERLLVTAVKAAADDGDQPSRFLAELGVQPQDIAHRPRRPLAVAALVAELRATTVDPESSPALREAAARRLARLAALTDDGHALVPAAHPDRWWGLYEPTRSEVPLRDREQPVALSGSALDQLANTCSLQWFLGREVKAEPPATTAQGFGNVVHVLADEVASGRTPADLDVLMTRLDSVWDALAFDAPWKSLQEKDNARAALERFLRWHVMERGRTAVGTEHDFDVTLGAGGARVRIRGSMDRVETDAGGQAYVVDFKTGRARPTAAEVARHPQLAVYQLAVREGAVDSLFGGERPPAGGAELVQLRLGAAKRDGGDALPVVQRQAPLEGPDGRWAEELLAKAAGRVLDERFTPAAGQHCAHCAFRASCTARPEGRHVVE
ncbi:ATP-dependent helicase [Actinacidiphila sp. ITFR-21]|uniref:ATP-dependent helicase n=1 Tax=Actinacidiphila sp. ITFR-21 TaxID=3075199 RepID=UPI00288984FC|nr:ATP-dependent DNA helicase [Streptomyces sp. ITFR-21]WNI19772.1 ATP-dependent DNA helicase [Streptomyces sp. ITFR-21]